MKRITLAFALALATTTVSAQVHVNPYFKHDGTYVQGYQRTAPNNTTLDNYSTRPNVNPYNGHQGTVNPYPQPTPQPSYTQPGHANPWR